MNIRFLIPTQQEVDDAVIWYNQQAPDLDMECLDELDKAIHRIAARNRAKK